MAERYLVTGVLGCLGAWVTRHLLEAGHDVVGFDLGTDRRRLALVLEDQALADSVQIVHGDITDLDQLERALDEHHVTRVIHLAALQVPLVRENPPLGMRVNVAGTVNVFEAVARRAERIPGLAYASSAAVFGPDDPRPAPESGGTRASTLYGVSKQAAESMARVYAAERGLRSIGIRPYVVYGPGRDQGLTSGPTVAMVEALRGDSYTIGFTGRAQYDFAPDVAEGFIRAAEVPSDEAAVVGTWPGERAAVSDVIAAIEAAVPEAAITCDGPTLPFPPELEATRLEVALGPLSLTPLAAGVAATIEHFRRVGV